MKTHSAASTKFTHRSFLPAPPPSSSSHGQIEVLEARIAPATIIVTDLGDNFTVDGKITLAEAIKAANTDTSIDGSVAGSGADIITFAPALTAGGPAAIHLTSLFAASPDDRSGLGAKDLGPTAFKITSSITIQGPTGDNGITIQRDAGAAEFRLFHVAPGSSLTVSDLTLAGGLAHGFKGGDAVGGGGGGSAGLGGAFINQGNLVLSNTLLVQNQALGGNGGDSNHFGTYVGGGGAGLGAAGETGNPGNLNTTLPGGSGGGPNGGAGGAPNAIGGNGGPGGGGGGTGSNPAGAPGTGAASGGFGGGGGGNSASSNTVLATGGAGGFGGGGGGAGADIGFATAPGGVSVFAGGSGGVGPTTTLNGGGGGGGAGMGGAIFNFGGTVNITNSTFSTNTATGGNGGGGSVTGSGGSAFGAALFNLDGTVVVQNATFANNILTAGAGGTPAKDGGAIYNLQLAGPGLPGTPANLTVNNTILANSVGGTDAVNNAGSFTGARNLIETNTGVAAGVIAFTSDPLLGTLQFNGGPTKTYAPKFNSPVIDAGLNAGAPATDQRGVFRPQDSEFNGTSTVEIGAYEVQSPVVNLATGGGAYDVQLEGTDVVVRNHATNAILYKENKDAIRGLFINGSAQSDVLNVISTNGLIALPDGINFDGGAGFDALNLQQTGGATQTSDQFVVGSLPGSGMSIITGVAGTQTVNFTGLEPVTDNVPAATFNITSVPGLASQLQASNAINYTASQILVGGGRVTVDAFEPVEFSNKTNLVIDAGAGSDTINLNYNSATNPTGLTGNITINGGDPTASDTLVVNGIGGILDNLRFVPSAAGAGTVFNDSAPQPNVVFTGIEHLDLVVRQADVDSVRVEGTTGNDNIEFFSGLGADTGTFRGTMDTNNATGSGPFQMTETTFHGASSVANDVDVNFFNPGGTDTFVFNGTANDDTIAVTSGEAGGTEFRNTLNGGIVARLEVFNVASTLVRALEGNDIVNVTLPAGPSATTLRVEGGDSDSSSDVLNYVAPTGSATTIDLGTSTITTTGGNSVTFSGFERINETSSGAGSTLTINGTSGDDTINVTSTGVGAGSFVRLGVGGSPQFTYTGIGAASGLTVNGGSGGFDVLGILGSEGLDTLTSTTTTITSNSGVVTFGTGLERVDVTTLGGDDNVNLSAFTGAAAIIRGGDGNDTLVGTTLADTLYGGFGNDILVGGAGDDNQYGEDGNDIFGNLTLTSDGVADDAGIDRNFGGAGFDNFVWEPGDGADFNNGGEDGADIFRFFGSAAANAFTLRPGGTPTHFNALIGAVNIDNHGIEDVVVDGQGGADTFVVDDLFTTEVVSLNLILGAADLAVDSVTINGRAANDTLLVSTPAAGSVRVSGLRYNVNLTSAESADALTVNGNDGNDTMNVAVGVAPIIGVTLNGGAGDDVLSGDAANINGGDGNDTLIGSAINNTMDGGAGDDTFLGNGGTDAIGGGAGSSVGDTILLPGTAGIDTLSLALNATGHLDATINGILTTYTNFIGGPIATSGVERIKADGQDGNDALAVDSTNGAVPIAITFDGGASSDSLILTGGTATADTYTPGPVLGAGTSTIVIGGVTQTVNFTGLEPVIDLVAGPLTVNANNAANSISYTVGRDNADTADDTTRGKVSIDAQEFINFSNKTALTINALGGDDTISLNNPNIPTGLTGITVNGGDPSASDSLVITGTAGADTFTFIGTSVSAGTVALTGVAPVAFTGTEKVLLDGQAGNDLFQVASAKGRVELRGGEDSDTVDFTGAASGVVFDLDLVNADQTVNATGEIIRLDEVIENFVGTAFNDVLRVKAAPFARTVFGGVEATLPPGDTLIFDGGGAVVNVQSVDANTGTFKTVGYADVAFDEFETKSIVNSPSGPGGFGTPGNSDAFSTAHIYDSLQFKIGGKPAPGKAPTAVATGDLNGDGFADMVVANSKSKNISVLINLGNGTFLDPVNLSTGKANPQDVVLGDFDGDGNLDAAVSLPTAGAISFFKGDGAGSFAAPMTTLTPKFKPFALATGDVNGDGDLDIVAVAKATNAVAVILGNGAGVFAPGAPVKTLGKNSTDVVVADFNGDGDLDVATANVSSNNISFLAGDGTGALGAVARFATGTQPTGLAAADLDNDGDLDLAVSNAVSRFVSILLSNGAVPAATQFAPQLRVAVPGLHQSSSVVAGDFDGDGIIDLGLGNRVGPNFTILRGLGAAAYTQPFEFNLGKDPASAVTGGIALADFNNDGLLDITATSLLRNDVRVLLRQI